MDDTLNSDLLKIEDWGSVNWVEFNAWKPNVVCYRTSEDPIRAKTFIWVVRQLQNRRLLMFWAHRYDPTFVGMIMFSSYIVLFYKYYFGKCSSGLAELVPPLQVFTRNTRLSGQSHAFTVTTMSHRTTHYIEKSFFTRTARLWNDLPTNIFAECFNISVFKARVNQHFLLSPPSI